MPYMYHQLVRLPVLSGACSACSPHVGPRRIHTTVCHAAPLPAAPSATAGPGFSPAFCHLQAPTLWPPRRVVFRGAAPERAHPPLRQRVQPAPLGGGQRAAAWGPSLLRLSSGICTSLPPGHRACYACCRHPHCCHTASGAMPWRCHAMSLYKVWVMRHAAAACCRHPRCCYTASGVMSRCSQAWMMRQAGARDQPGMRL